MTIRTRSKAVAGWAAAGEREPSGFGDTELKSFAAAAVRINRINRTFTPQIRGAGSGTERMQIERRASGAVFEAVRNEGLTFDRYETIANRLQTDPALTERVKEKLKDLVA